MLEWKQVTKDGSTWKLKVPGGWIVRYSDDIVHDRAIYGRGLESGWDWRSSIVFVPDPEWYWLVE